MSHSSPMKTIVQCRTLLFQVLIYIIIINCCSSDGRRIIFATSHKPLESTKLQPTRTLTFITQDKPLFHSKKDVNEISFHSRENDIEMESRKRVYKIWLKSTLKAKAKEKKKKEENRLPKSKKFIDVEKIKQDLNELQSFLNKIEEMKRDLNKWGRV